VFGHNEWCVDAWPLAQVPHRELGGAVTSWEEIRKIRALCDSKEIHLHMDGGCFVVGMLLKACLCADIVAA
jgi:threonine aldolase